MQSGCTLHTIWEIPRNATVIPAHYLPGLLDSPAFKGRNGSLRCFKIAFQGRPVDNNVVNNGDYKYNRRYIVQPVRYHI